MKVQLAKIKADNEKSGKTNDHKVSQLALVRGSRLINEGQL
jgi:hypothetical protein